MTVPEIRVGDQLRLQFVVKDEKGEPLDLSQNTALSLILRKPGLRGQLLTLTPALVTDGIDGQVYYQCTDELSTPGEYRAQIKATLSYGKRSSTIVRFVVYDNLH